MFKINSMNKLKYWWKKWNKKIPKNISKKSEKEQIIQTKKIYCFLRPCSITNIFCAPIAKIKLRPVINPNKKYSNYLNQC